MKHTVLWLLCSLLLLFAACKDEPEAPRLEVGSRTILFGVDDSSSRSVSIDCNTDWTVSSSADWLGVSPQQGTAHHKTITLTPLTGNFSPTERQATVTIRTATLSRTISVTQYTSTGGDNVWGVKDEYRVEAGGGYIDIQITTNVPPGMLYVKGDEEDSWIVKDSTWTEENGEQTPILQSRWESGMVLRFKVQPNEGRLTRMSTLSFVKTYPWGETISTLKTTSIVQEGTPDTSTDFSQDGKVTRLQTASQGEGVPIVLAGDGFIDKDIADGTYDKVMKETMEALFSIRPLQALRQYFDVYAVTAVSHNNDFGGDNRTAFSCQYKSKQSTLITGSDKAVQEYARKTKANMNEVLFIVVLNATQYGGTTTFGYLNSSGKYVNFAIAYCPLMDGTDSHKFRQVLVHEAMGHGLAKLGDEYAYQGQGTIPSAEAQKLEQLQQQGWMQNLSLSGIPQQTPWSKFVADERYDAERLGAYQGAYSYWEGVYRPTANSIMNLDGEQFNAPSREAIYKRVMASSSPTWTYDYDAFVEFDAPLSPSVSRSRSSLSLPSPLSPPLIANKMLGQD